MLLGRGDMHGLYAIVDVGTLEARGLDALAFARAVLDACPAALQLRAKDLPSREVLALLRALVPLCRRAGVPLVANDRPDLALLAGCDFVHLGQSDMPIEQARRLARGLGVGLSTHSIEQIEVALRAAPAYVAFGPVFDTATKENPDPVVGVEALREAHRLAAASGVPLVAIGGITRERAGRLVGAADAIAVIGDLVPAVAVAQGALEEVTERARVFRSMFTAAPAPAVR